MLPSFQISKVMAYFIIVMLVPHIKIYILPQLSCVIIYNCMSITITWAQYFFFNLICHVRPLRQIVYLCVTSINVVLLCLFYFYFLTLRQVGHVWKVENTLRVFEINGFFPKVNAYCVNAKMHFVDCFFFGLKLASYILFL